MSSRTIYGWMLNCNVPEKTRKAVQRISENENTTLSEVVRDLLYEALRNRGLEAQKMIVNARDGESPATQPKAHNSGRQTLSRTKDDSHHRSLQDEEER
jgi:hypothetical protein